MPVATDAGQQSRYWQLVQQVEDAVDDPNALGALRSRVKAMDLADEDRRELLGRVAEYLGDIDREGDPWERYARGEGPLPDGDPPPTVDDSDAADAALDVEDGFEPVDAPTPN